MAKYGINRLTIIGTLGKDPDFKFLDQGIAFASLWLAVTERIPAKDGQYQDRTEWISVNLWRQQAEIASKYCRKGNTICIEGRVRTRSYDAPDGTKRSVTEVEGSRIVLLDRPNEANNGPMSQPVAQTYSQPVSAPAAMPQQQAQQPMTGTGDFGSATIDDDLPF